jgi:hypothetical protein
LRLGLDLNRPSQPRLSDLPWNFGSIYPFPDAP